jgi:hypothetical protein
MSAAWRVRSPHLIKLLDRLEVEHMAHAGKENGFLAVSYDQLVEYGIGRRFIKAAIEEGEQLGLLEVTYRGCYMGPLVGRPSTYRITYAYWKFQPAIGSPQYLGPTDEWRAFKGPKPKRRPRRRRANVLRLVPKN